MTSEIGVRELRNEVSEVLRRVETGDQFVVTVHGRPVARVTPLDSRPRTMPTEVFFAALAKVASDQGVLGDLKEAVGDTSDDIRM